MSYRSEPVMTQMNITHDVPGTGWAPTDLYFKWPSKVLQTGNSGYISTDRSYFIPFITDNGPPCHFSLTCDFLRFNDTFSDSLQSGWYLTEINLDVPES